jgi:hypothetical protein
VVLGVGAYRPPPRRPVNVQGCFISLAPGGVGPGHWVALVCSPRVRAGCLGYCAGLRGWGHVGVVAEDLDLPDELFGFGSWLLWVLATRTTDVVDRAFGAGPARLSRHCGMVDGHLVPTSSLVPAAESGLAPTQSGLWH